MAKEKDLKLITVQKIRPELYQKVMNGELSVHDAFNEVQRQQLGISELRGTNHKKKGFSDDFKRIIRLHDPSPEELSVEIKKLFPYTWKEILKS